MIKLLIGKALGFLGLGKVKLILAGVMAASALLVWWSYGNVKADRDAYMVAVQRANDAHAVTTASYDTYRQQVEQDMLELRRNIATLSNKYREAEVQRNELKKLLSEINLSSYMASDPATAEHSINERTRRLFDGLAEASRSGSSGPAH